MLPSVREPGQASSGGSNSCDKHVIVGGTGNGMTLHSISRHRAHDVISLHTKIQSTNICLPQKCRISVQAHAILVFVGVTPMNVPLTLTPIVPY